MTLLVTYITLSVGFIFGWALHSSLRFSQELAEIEMLRQECRSLRHENQKLVAFLEDTGLRTATGW